MYLLHLVHTIPNQTVVFRLPFDELVGTFHISVTAVNKNMLFTTGEGRYQHYTYMYYGDTAEWVQLADLPVGGEYDGRYGMACGTVSVTGVDGSEQLEVVVAGGYDQDGDRLDSVLIFNVQDGTWRTGEYLAVFPVK